MEEREYLRLTDERDRLRSLLEKATLMRHKVWLMSDLNNVRERIKNAHRERNNNSKSK